MTNVWFVTVQNADLSMHSSTWTLQLSRIWLLGESTSRCILTQLKPNTRNDVVKVPKCLFPKLNPDMCLEEVPSLRFQRHESHNGLKVGWNIFQPLDPSHAKNQSCEEFTRHPRTLFEHMACYGYLLWFQYPTQVVEGHGLQHPWGWKLTNCQGKLPSALPSISNKDSNSLAPGKRWSLCLKVSHL